MAKVRSARHGPRSRRARSLLVLLAIVASGSVASVIGCGDDSKPPPFIAPAAPPNNWDQMNWDQGQWQ